VCIQGYIWKFVPLHSKNLVHDNALDYTEKNEEVIMKKKYNSGAGPYMPSSALLTFSLAYVKDTTFLPMTLSYAHRSVGVSLNSCAIFMYVFVLWISMIKKKLKISDPQRFK